MYNRYLQNNCPPSEPSKPSRPPQPCPPPSCPPQPCPPEPCPEPCKDKDDGSGGLLSSLSGLLGGKGGLSKLLDDNTWIIFVVLFFLLKDDEDGIDHDLLILAGIFLLLGL